MKQTRLILLLVFILSGCSHEVQPKKEPWMEKPISEWPDFALTNQISFKDTTFTDLANAFLVDTGTDTIGVSCKHMFLVFRDLLGFNSVDLGESFIYWNFYPKNKPKKIIQAKYLINANAKERIDAFRILKDKDWIVFELDEKKHDVYPLKLRYTPIKKGEIVYSVGWGAKQTNNEFPAIIKLRCFKNAGNYYYVNTLKSSHQPNGRSGSPVIDKNGYLVGIISGAEGNLGVVGSVIYLQKLFDTYGINYSASY